MDTALQAAISSMTTTVNALTTSTPQRLTFGPSWPIRRPNMLDFYPSNAFLNPLKASNPNPRNRANSLFLTHCSTKPNTDRENATDNKNSPFEKPNSNIQEPRKLTSSQPLSSSNSSFSRGLVFDLGLKSSWDGFEIGSPVVKRYLSDEKERWYMWYHGKSEGNPGPDSIGLAVSSNGIHWERSGGRVTSSEDTGLVMDCSKDWWAFDTQSIRPCEVVIMSSAKVRANAVYWLYYTGFSSEIVEFWDNSVEFGLENPERVRIQDDETGRTSKVFRSLPGLAMSQDGRHWARIEGEHHTGALFDVGSKGEWDSMFIASPQVVFHSSGDLRMFYHSFDVENGVFAVGVARSRDGIKWVKLGKIIGGGGNGAFDELGVVNARVVRTRTDGKFVMVYEGVAADGGRSIGLAMSTDGLKNWQRVQGEAVLKPSEEDGWDSLGVGSPCLVQMDGDADEWRLYYKGIGKRGETGIGMAVSEGSEIRSFRREAYACSREEDMTPSCFCNCINDVYPRPLNPNDIYQQFEIFPCQRGCRSGTFSAKSVAPDGFPHHFLRRRGWEIFTKTPKTYELGEALGTNTTIRACLPNFDSPVVVGKWYCPFMFVKDGNLKDQMKQSLFYEMTLEQRWEKIFACENNFSSQGNSVSVEAEVQREVVFLAIVDVFVGTAGCCSVVVLGGIAAAGLRLWGFGGVWWAAVMLQLGFGVWVGLGLSHVFLGFGLYRCLCLFIWALSLLSGL
ncbi:hypothetical protein RHMOL_Rhmol12G0086700 [Rhododendron molle]|uniref:Uncharacterized protein n=1 Tax=Rhododendron molle TaxID=49168 RepID=A0ACC0LG42_RHOML|nr:hypothetical protein RHMOL_Rhmol12G0086700 [Rhododendron molle]